MPFDFTIKQTRVSRGGRPVRDMSPQAARIEAQRLQQSLSEHAWDTIEILTQAGVLSTEQLRPIVSHRTLTRSYAPKRIIDRLPHTRTEMETAFTEHGLPFTEKTNLYTLGPVGIELALMRSQTPPVTGFVSYRLTRVMHDVCVNEIMLRMAVFASERGWKALWAGTNEATLYNADGTRQLLEPDAMLILKRSGTAPRRFMIEYHNEDHRTRAERKIDKYVNVCEINADRWQAAWATPTFPPVLAVFAKRIVGEGYQDKLNECAAPVHFYGKLFRGVLKNSLEKWANFTTQQNEMIWE